MSNKDMTAEVVKRLNRREEERKQEEAERIEAVCKVVALCIAGAIAGTLFAFATKSFNEWSKDNEIIINSPIRVEFRELITIKKRDLVVVINKTEVVDKVVTENTTEELVCLRFPISDCKVAIAIMKAESNADNTAFNVNNNGSIDVGLFQINSIHFKTAGCSLQEVTTVDGNIDCAYSIFKQFGWSAWSSFNSGAINKFLK